MKAIMRKFFITISLVVSCLMAKAQEPQIVSTEPSNRNVLIEELTGRACSWCPVGQKFVNQTIEENPGRVFTINIHKEGGWSPTSYPNLNTLKGGDISSAFGDGSLPQAMVNRTEDKAVGLSTSENYWDQMAREQMSQAAECNIAGHVSINPDTRLARITVEVYYTADSKVEANYLTVVMLQDSIMGAQSGASGNPAQVIGDMYCHMHVYRNTITEKWGNEISPTTAGTLIRKTFKYTIPESIGTPNGVEVDLNNIQFLAFVTETRSSGARTMPVLNVNKLDIVEPGTSVDDAAEISSDVYPNPVKDVLKVSADNISRVVIYNSLGQIVKLVECNDNSVNVNVSDLQNGVYFVNVIGNDGAVSTNKVSVLR